MAAKLKMLLRLYKHYAKMDFAWLTQDTLNCVIVVASDVVSNLSAVVGLLLVAIRFHGIGGLDENEVLFLLSYNMLAGGFEMLMVGGGNVNSISRRIARGQLDHMLIQPVPLWMQLLAEGFLPATGSQTFICGAVMLGISIARLNMAVTPMFLLALPLLLISRVLIEMGLSYIASCRAFYYPVQYEEVAANVASLCGQIEYYPLSGLPQVLQLVLDTVLPLGLLTYVPSLILLGRLPYLLTAWPLLVGLILCNIAAALFRKGLVHYANKGCSRYKSMGHRS